MAFLSACFLDFKSYLNALLILSSVLMSIIYLDSVNCVKKSNLMSGLCDMFVLLPTHYFSLLIDE